MCDSHAREMHHLHYIGWTAECKKLQFRWRIRRSHGENIQRQFEKLQMGTGTVCSALLGRFGQLSRHLGFIIAATARHNGWCVERGHGTTGASRLVCVCCVVHSAMGRPWFVREKGAGIGKFACAHRGVFEQTNKEAPQRIARVVSGCATSARGIFGLLVGANSQIASRQLGREAHCAAISCVRLDFVRSTATQFAGHQSSATQRQLRVSHAMGRLPHVWLHRLPRWPNSARCALHWTFPDRRALASYHRNASPRAKGLRRSFVELSTQKQDSTRVLYRRGDFLRAIPHANATLLGNLLRIHFDRIVQTATIDIATGVGSSNWNLVHANWCNEHIVLRSLRQLVLVPFE